MEAQKKSARRKSLVIIGLILIVGLLVIVFIGYPKAMRVKGLLVSTRRHLWVLQDLTGFQKPVRSPVEDLKAIGEELAQAEADFRALQAELGPLLPLCRYLGWVPLVGKDVQAAPHLLEIAVGVTAAGNMALEGLQPLVDLFSEDKPPTQEVGEVPVLSSVEVIVPVLVAQQPKFAGAQTKLTQAAQARAEIDKSKLSPQVAALVDRLDRYLPLLQFALQGVLLAPELLGASEPKSYLILAQNEDEIRATGGFISGVGLLHVDQGRIGELNFQDSYAVDDLSQPHAEPPLPLYRYLWAQIWLLRDANWSPDFPTTAQTAARIYEQDQGVAVDGVMALDQQAVRLVVGALGPLRLEGYEESVTADNVIQLARQYWASPLGAGTLGEGAGDWWAHRKDFMGALLKATMAELEGEVTPAEAIELARAIRQAVEERHLLIWLDDAAAAELLREAGWDGAILSTDGDYLMVVDTNMGFNKVNLNVDQALHYRVTIDEAGNVRAVATLTYHNMSTREVEECVQEARYDLTYEGMMNRCYWDYLRLYVPEGASLVVATSNPLPPGSLYRKLSGAGAGTGEPDIGPPEKGKQVFGTFFVVPPQESKEVHFTYELPSGILDGPGDGYRYGLLIQKQPGTMALPFQATVELPPGAELVAAEPQPDAVEGNILRYRLTLATDRRLEVTFR
jgi:hypothetical protein